MRDETRSSIASGGMFAALAGLQDRAESGQIMVSLLLMLSIFLLAIVGFAVDLTNLWFHRQAAQTAADAACQAGAMDMAALAAGMALPNMGFTPGTPARLHLGYRHDLFLCQCQRLQRLTGLWPTAPSNSVTWSFPSFCSECDDTPRNDHVVSVFEGCGDGKCEDTFSVHDFTDTSYQKVAASCTCGTTAGSGGGADGGAEPHRFGRIHLCRRWSPDDRGRPAAGIAGQFHQPHGHQLSAFRLDRYQPRTVPRGPAPASVSPAAHRRRQRRVGEAASKGARQEDGLAEFSPWATPMPAWRFPPR